MRRRMLLGKTGGDVLVTDKVAGFIIGWSKARKLRKAYTGNIIEVRRSSDDTTQNIGIADNVLNESQLTTFTGAGNGFIRQLYDQCGAREIGQGTNGIQPIIVSSGTVVKVSGRPYGDYSGANRFLGSGGGFSGDATPITDKDCCVFVVFESQSTVSVQGVFEEQTGGSGTDRTIIFSDTRASSFNHSNYRPVSTANSLVFSSQQPTSTKRILIFRKSGDTIEAYDENNTLIDSITTSDVFSADTFLGLGRQLPGNLFFNGKISECLINNTALDSTNRQIIIDDIKDFYSIT